MLEHELSRRAVGVVELLFIAESIRIVVVVVGVVMLAGFGFEVNLLLLAKVPVCHCISQKPPLDASLESSPMLISSSLGDSAPQITPV